MSFYHKHVVYYECGKYKLRGRYYFLAAAVVWFGGNWAVWHFLSR